MARGEAGLNVAISGLTAAGKTTHARLLAQELGYDYVSATEILLSLLDVPAAERESVWFKHSAEIERAREGDELDLALEAQLIDIAENRRRVVLDTWSTPWLYKGPMVRIWFESDRLSRSWKCQVSQGKEQTLDTVACTRLIDEKDAATRANFRRRHNFDLFQDHDEFDAILCNTWLIDEPTRASSDRGIAAFRPFVSAAARLFLGKAGSAEINAMHAHYGPHQESPIHFLRGYDASVLDGLK
jgi:cytidylate kinase